MTWNIGKAEHGGFVGSQVVPKAFFDLSTETLDLYLRITLSRTLDPLHDRQAGIGAPLLPTGTKAPDAPVISSWHRTSS